jgi:hypothetical protein
VRVRLERSLARGVTFNKRIKGIYKARFYKIQKFVLKSLGIFRGVESMNEEMLRPFEGQLGMRKSIKIKREDDDDHDNVH